MVATLKPLPPADAIAAYEARRGALTESFSWQDVWESEHATMLTVARSAGFDILKDIDSALSKLLLEGQTPEQVSRLLIPVLKDKGWWGRKPVLDPQTGEITVAQLGSPRRLETIFETNMRVSYASGHWANFERNKGARPYLRYVCVLDDRTRPAHRARHNLVLPVDHPYWNAWAPPCGWGCRCTLQSLSQRDIDRLLADGEKLVFEPPRDTFRKFVNKRTGEVTEVPDGIDPGWAYNPGKAGWQALQATQKLIDAPPELAAAAGSLPTFLHQPTAAAFPAWLARPLLAARSTRPDRCRRHRSRDTEDPARAADQSGLGRHYPDAAPGAAPAARQQSGARPVRSGRGARDPADDPEKPAGDPARSAQQHAALCVRRSG